jgi:Protein kinase domain
VQPLDPRRDPVRLGPFTLIGRLGAGGMGKVYLGRSPGGRKVAVKVVHAHLLDDDPTFRSRFRHEVEAAKRVGGFYTAAIVDSDAIGDPPWYASAYIDAPTLHEVIDREGPLDVDGAYALGAGLAEALQAIHAVDLVHRDLKPSNVLMAPDGPRVIDFGIVRVTDVGTALTGTGMRLGTIGYLSPEQLYGRPVTPASDVFALGVLLVYATTAHLPFPGTTDVAVARRMDQAPDLSGVPQPLRDLLRRCLAIDPVARPGLAELLTSFGEGAAHHTGSSARPAGPRAPRPTRVDSAAGEQDRRVAEPVAAAPAAEPVAQAPEAAEYPRPVARSGSDPTSGSPGLGALLAGAATALQLSWLGDVSWLWAIGGGLLVLAGAWALLSAGQARSREDEEELGFGGFALVGCGLGVVVATLAWQRTGWPWWADVLLGLGGVVAGYFGGCVVNGAVESAFSGRLVGAATVVAMAVSLLLLVLLLWWAGTAVWLAMVLSVAAWTALTVLITAVLPRTAVSPR